MNEITGLTIKAYRERLQMSQYELADTVGVSQGAISQIEVGRTAISRKILRLFRLKGEDGTLSPSLSEFLESGAVQLEPAEAELNILQRIPLENWVPALDLASPFEKNIVTHLTLPGIPSNARAFRFTPPPEIIYPDSIVIFRPAKLTDLVDGEIMLMQFKKMKTKGVVLGRAYLGQLIASGRRTQRIYQAKLSGGELPVVEIETTSFEILMSCCFRGRYSQLSST